VAVARKKEAARGEGYLVGHSLQNLSDQIREITPLGSSTYKTCGGNKRVKVAPNQQRTRDNNVKHCRVVNQIKCVQWWERLLFGVKVGFECKGAPHNQRSENTQTIIM
jgi:hypothetical protein